MTKYQFKEAFKRGLGNAQVELQNCKDPQIYKDIVLFCCLHNTCYDMQCEGSRCDYLYSAIETLGDKSYFEEEIIRKFNQASIDSWVYDQLAGLLFLFTKDGSTIAREALYNKFYYLFDKLSHAIKWEMDDCSSFEWVCVWLTTLDGFSAFKMIVERVGAYLESAKENNGFSMDWFYTNSKNKLGNKRIESYMQRQAEKSTVAKVFLTEVQIFENHMNEPLQTPTLDELVNACKARFEILSEAEKNYNIKNRSIARSFAKKSCHEDLVALAKLAIVEENIEIKAELLWAFRWVAFPLEDDYIFELVKSEIEDIRDTAFYMMDNLQSKRAYDYAVELLNVGKELANAIVLLCKNYVPKDEVLLFNNLKKLPINKNNADWHYAFMAVDDVFRLHKYKPKTDILEYMYHKSTCSSCRYRFVETMYKRNVLPENILHECLFDSHEDIRKFANKKLKGVSS